MEPTRADRRISFAFTAVIVTAFGGFLALGAAAPAVFSAGVVGIIPLSLVLAAGLIVGAIALTGLYVVVANRRAR